VQVEYGDWESEQRHDSNPIEHERTCYSTTCNSNISLPRAKAKGRASKLRAYQKVQRYLSWKLWKSCLACHVCSLRSMYLYMYLKAVLLY
jgi:hypothetical protein